MGRAVATRLLAVVMVVGCTRTTSTTAGPLDAQTDAGSLDDRPAPMDVRAEGGRGEVGVRDVPTSRVDVRDVVLWYDCFGGYAFPRDADITNPPPMEEWPTLTCGGPDVWLSRVCCPEAEVYDRGINDHVRDGVSCASPRNCRLTWPE